jgi:hypothetical protein
MTSSAVSPSVSRWNGSNWPLKSAKLLPVIGSSAATGVTTRVPASTW